MTLGSSGAAMIEARKIKEEKPPVDAAVAAKPTQNPHRPDRMQSFFNTVMGHFLKKPSEEKCREQSRVREVSDVDMESIESFPPSPGENNPDDLSIDIPR
ncbi:hypothetical protein PHMEG_0006993 [Phytophthora megakarya]|uniref:Uncharacterized protein n=1 Tax=Phytophthora megakarya TaxID=4795 RepID=A0A225WMH8_9STRA|nr:hypothetical protein PHMEG_0006993 [Phytophthora megakarya]